MKKIFLAATIAVIFSTGLISKAQAQTVAANIEILGGADVNAFISKIISETPLYDNQGNFLGTVKRYEASSLPQEISSIMDKRFNDYSVIGVEEVAIPSEKTRIYYVHISNDKRIETVKVFNGETTVINKYKKG